MMIIIANILFFFILFQLLYDMMMNFFYGILVVHNAAFSTHS